MWRASEWTEFLPVKLRLQRQSVRSIVKKSMKVFRKQKSDQDRKQKLSSALRKVSEKKAKQAMKPVAAPSLSPSTKIKLNISGNRRGMHNADNPPDSEEMRRRRSMRRLWNKHLPALACSNCQFSAQCPQFKAGYECSFLPFLNSHKIDNEHDLIFYAKELLGENLKRAQLTMIMERLSGASPSLDVSEALMALFTQLMQMHERLTKPDTQVEIESSDGTIIGKLFGGIDKLLGDTRASHGSPIDVPNVSGEVALAEREQLQLIENRPAPDKDLMGELAFIKTGSPAVSVTATPITEEL